MSGLAHATISRLVEGLLFIPVAALGYLAFRAYKASPWLNSGPIFKAGDAVQIMKAESIVRRGRHVTAIPAAVIIGAATVGTDHVHAMLPSFAVFVAGVSVALAWSLLALRWWWRWARLQGVDPVLIVDMARDAHLLGHSGSATWNRLAGWIDLPVIGDQSAEEFERTDPPGTIASADRH